MTTALPAALAGGFMLVAWGAFSTAAERGSTQSTPARSWKAAWAASAHGPYPSGNATAQPVLSFAFESATTGATDQTFRLVVKPDIWGQEVRVRFTNAFGTRPVTFDDAYVGLQESGANVVEGTNQPLTFGTRPGITLQPGQTAFSDAVRLPFVPVSGHALLAGRKLAISFHIDGSSGPMTWHAKALTTSYVSDAKSGRHGADLQDDAFPNSTTSWYFIDAVDVMASNDTAVIAAFGDSITDGTASTINGDDRWPDVLSRRLHAARATAVSVVNAGIGGNQVIGPPQYSADAPFAGGPSALSRLDRDVLSLSGLTTVIWLEGINDISAGATAEAVIAGMRDGVARLRARGVRVIGATITSALGYTGASGTPEADARRLAINAFIRTPGSFDAVADFDAATVDSNTGGLRAAFQPNSSTGGAGDKLHPNRAGYLAMGNAVDLADLLPAPQPPPEASSNR